MGRPTLNETFIKAALTISERSTCLRQKVGCIIANGGRIISCGYNGVASGMDHCIDRGICYKDEKGDENHKFCLHAEQNSICQCAKHGISTEDSVLYTTEYPCMSCAKMILSSGICEVVVSKKADKSKTEDGIQFLDDNRVLVEFC